LAFIAFSAGSTSGGQTNDISRPIRRVQQREDRLEARMATPSQVHVRIDRAQVRRDAEELARLASSIPPEVAGVEKGVVSKDLNENLKKIQKLCKHLRSELAL
jgi:hypothetical protein